jgi:hypothetical protein
MNTNNKKVIVAIVVFIAVLAALGFYFYKSDSASTASSENVYKDFDRGYTISFPSKISSSNVVDDNTFQIFDGRSNRGDQGVEFLIPKSMTIGTNLSKDSSIDITQDSKDIECSAKNSELPNSKVFSLSDKGVQYFVATTSDAAAGNRYEQVVYTIVNSKPCTTIGYNIHSTVFENYPEGTVKRFDKQALIKTFDEIRRSLVLLNK